MNFGRFFKLNQNLSSTVNGVTIFDYTELPAFVGLDSNNLMSPKFPISISITDNAVRFKMHYCVYRCSNYERQVTQKQDKDLYPYYGFSIDDIKQELYMNYPEETYEQDIINAVHIEEIILDLPFAGYKAKSLTEIIKKSYIANFPQIREGEDRDPMDLTGNRFLDKLIQERFKDKNIKSDAASYSTLWLMDLYDNDGKISLKKDGDEKNGLINKFLRKLLLDFMFDLKHSDVFKTSVNYDQMYSGLMSNYYFSALMHKCEYYYYRDLTYQAIENQEHKKKDDEIKAYKEIEKREYELRKKENEVIHQAIKAYEEKKKNAAEMRNQMNTAINQAIKAYEEKKKNEDELCKQVEELREHVDEVISQVIKAREARRDNDESQAREEKKKNEVELRKHEDRIIVLYASELYAAEEQWASDIRNPLSDELFENKYPNDFIKFSLGNDLTAFLSLLIERMTRKHWDSWFASPEEEMRRIYFPFKTYCGKKDVCNSATLTEKFYLLSNKSEVSQVLSQKMVSLSEECREKSSKWFLNRYDFNDVFHLHLFRGANLLLMLSFLLTITTFCSTRIYELLSNIINSYDINVWKLWGFLGLIIIFQLFIIQIKKNNQLNGYYSRRVTKKFWIVAAISSAIAFMALVFLKCLGETVYNNPIRLCLNEYKELFDAAEFINLGNYNVVNLALNDFIKQLSSTSYTFSLCIMSAGFIIVWLTKLAIHIRWPKWRILSITFHPIGAAHMFLPKLTASIITAWITLTVAWNRGLGPLKDKLIEILVVSLLIVLILCFFLYLVDHACRSCGFWRKLFRSMELLLISFFVSFGVGCVFLRIFNLNSDITDLSVAALFAVFIGLYLRMIFRTEKQMTDI